MGTLGERAVVIGGGMGGLFAAAAAADHFDEVVMLDRDEEPAGPVPRKSVPQGQHFHVLLPGGMDAMTEWFPGFPDDLLAAGSIPMIAGREFYAYTPEGKSYSLFQYQPEPEDGDLMYVQTRPLLEHCVRRRVHGLANVSQRNRVVVDQPLVRDGAVAGVTVRDGDPVEADLVIDSSGRNSCSARWLDSLGVAQVEESHINCDIQYVSVVVEPDDWDFFEGVVFFIGAAREGDYPNRGAAVIKLEDGKWLFNLVTRHDDSCPTDWEGLLAFGETLISDEWSRCAAVSRPVSEIQSYRLPRAVRRHYDRLEWFPDGLVPVGDAICYFNPTYGQGMSAAAGQVRGLRSQMAERAGTGAGLDGLALDFFPIADAWVRGPWVMAAMGDLDFPECTGDMPVAELEDLGIMGQLMASADDPAAGKLVRDVISLRKPLSAVRDLAAT